MKSKGEFSIHFFTTKPVGKGSGMGLSICHQIVVEKHGGQLESVSTPGKGTELRSGFWRMKQHYWTLD